MDSWHSNEPIVSSRASNSKTNKTNKLGLRIPDEILDYLNWNAELSDSILAWFKSVDSNLNALLVQTLTRSQLSIVLEQMGFLPLSGASGERGGEGEGQQEQEQEQVQEQEQKRIQEPQEEESKQTTHHDTHETQVARRFQHGKGGETRKQRVTKKSRKASTMKASPRLVALCQTGIQTGSQTSQVSQDSASAHGGSVSNQNQDPNPETPKTPKTPKTQKNPKNPINQSHSSSSTYFSFSDFPPPVPSSPPSPLPALGSSSAAIVASDPSISGSGTSPHAMNFEGKHKVSASASASTSVPVSETTRPMSQRSQRAPVLSLWATPTASGMKAEGEKEKEETERERERQGGSESRQAGGGTDSDIAQERRGVILLWDTPHLLPRSRSRASSVASRKSSFASVHRPGHRPRTPCLSRPLSASASASQQGGIRTTGEERAGGKESKENKEVKHDQEEQEIKAETEFAQMKRQKEVLPEEMKPALRVVDAHLQSIVDNFRTKRSLAEYQHFKEELMEAMNKKSYEKACLEKLMSFQLPWCPEEIQMFRANCYVHGLRAIRKVIQNRIKQLQILTAKPTLRKKQEILKSVFCYEEKEVAPFHLLWDALANYEILITTLLVQGQRHEDRV